jgi:CYTH domain-containing protein
MAENIEIERKFLLKAIPLMYFDKAIMISQVYVSDKNSSVTERVRFTQEGEDVKCFHTKKTKIDAMSSEEIELEISLEEGQKMIEACEIPREIDKVRWVKEYGDLKWEIDEFRNLDLIIAEIELPTRDTAVELPQEIQDVLIMEVTGMKEFSNSNLAR